MIIKIKNDKKNTLLYKRRLRRKGFLWVETANANGYWEKKCTDREAKVIQRFCKRKGLKAIVYEKNYSRNDYYRKGFLNNNKGLFGNGRFYVCVYCGKIVSRKKITVDHLIPVDKVLQGNQKEKYRKKLKKQGIDNVNQVKNLVPACHSCNQKKSNKAGIWIIRGKIGRITWLWIIRWYMRIYILLTVLYLIFIQGYLPGVVSFIGKWCVYGVNLIKEYLPMVGSKILIGVEIIKNIFR